MKVNKKITITSIIMLIILSISSISFAGSGNVYVHWYEDSRKDTYTYANKHCSSMGYSVIGYNTGVPISQIKSQLKTGKIFIVHNHGGPGYQCFGSGNIKLCGKNADNENSYGINMYNNGDLSNLKIAIYYGCSTGQVSAKYGDICQTTVQKGAQCAVAWTVTTYTAEVNEWNKAFLDKCKTKSISESLGHADYWTGVWKGSAAKERMQNHRNIRGNINGMIN